MGTGGYFISSKTSATLAYFICLTFLILDPGRAVSLTNNVGEHPLSGEFKSYLDARNLEFADNVHQNFKQRRHRREVAETEQDYQLSWQIEPSSLIFNGTTVLEHFYVDGEFYFIVGKPRSDDGGYEAQAILYKYDMATDTYVETGLSLSTYGLSDIASHLIGGYIYIAIANQQFADDMFNGLSQVFRFDHGKVSLKSMMAIFTMGASDMEFFEYEGDVYLAITNMRSDLHQYLQGTLEIYEFVSSHFDFVVSTVTYGATSVEPYELDETMYLAVSQYSDNDGNYNVGTNVYQFNTELLELHIIQNIPSSAAMHVTVFEVQHHYFLAIANHLVEEEGLTSFETKSQIYWWEGQQFWEYQNIPTNGANYMTYLALSDDIAVLAVVNSKEDFQSVVFYQYDEFSGDWLEATQQLPIGEEESPATKALTTITIDDEILIAIANSGLNNTIFYKFSYFNETLDLESIKAAKMRPAGSCLQSVEEQVHLARHNLTSLQDKLDRSLSLTESQNITSRIVHYGNVTLHGTIIVYNKITVVSEYGYEMDSEVLAAIETNLERLRTLLLEIDAEAVTLDGDQTVEGYKVFQELVTITELTHANLTVLDGHINELDLDDLKDTVLRNVGSHILDGLNTFGAPVTLQGSLNLTGLVNGIKIPDDVMTLTGTQRSLGHLTFETSVTFGADVEVQGHVNALNLSQDVVTTFRNHVVGGYKSVVGVIVTVEGVGIKYGATIDGVDVSEFSSQVVLLSEGGIIRGSIEFSGDVIFDNITISNNMISGIDIAMLIADIVFKDTDQTIIGLKNYTQVLVISGNLNITGTINGIDVSEELITLSSDQRIFTDIRVENAVTVRGDITIRTRLNAVDLSAEAVFVTGNQTITGPVNFTSDVTVHGNIDMPEGATISGVDISELNSTTVKIEGPLIIAGIKCFGESVLVAGDIIVSGLIGTFNITELAADIVSLTRSQTFYRPTQVESWVTLQGNVTLRSTIDSYSLSDFILLDTDEDIRGHKTLWFSTMIFGHLNLTVGQPINGVNLTMLDNEVLRNVGNQYVKGPIIITSDLYVKGDVHVLGLVNGYDFEADLVTLYGSHDIAGFKTFTNATVQESVYADNINITAGTISGVDILALLKNAVLNGHDDIIYGSKIFLNIEVFGDLHIGGSVNGVDLVVFSTTVATLSEDQTIHGNITFLSDIQFDNVTITETVNDVDIETESPLIVLKDTDGPIYGDKRFGSDILILADLYVGDFVNGINITQVQLLYLSRTIPQFIAVKMRFLQVIHIENLVIDLDSFLDGVNISSIVLVNVDETFSVSIAFAADVTVRNDATVVGLVNGADILKLNRTAVRIAGPAQLVNGTKQFWSAIVEGNVTMVHYATVNGIDISELGNNVVTTYGNQTVNLYTVFEKPVRINGNLESYDLIGPIYLRFLLEDAVFFNTTKPIAGAKVFKAPVFIAHLDIDGDLQTDIIHGNTSLLYLLNNMVTMTTNQTIEGDVTFSRDLILIDDLIVNGTVDGIDLSEQVVLTYSDQTILRRVVFQAGFEVVGNMQVSGLVDLVNLKVLVNTLVSLTEPQVIEGEWTFAENVNVIRSVIIGGHVNNITVRNELVTLTGAQDLRGFKTFFGNVTILGNLNCSAINGVDLEEFRNDIVFHSGDFVITANKTISAPFTSLQNATVEGFVDGINVTEMYSDHIENTIYVEAHIAELNLTVQLLCPGVYSLQLAVSGQPLLLSHWEDYQMFDSSFVSFFDTISYKGATLLAMSESANMPCDGCIYTSLYLCPPSDPCWLQDDTLGSASSVKFFTFDEKTFLVVTRSAQNLQCGDQIGTMTSTEVLLIGDRDYKAEVESETPADSTMFKIDGDVYLAIANYENPYTADTSANSTVHKYNDTTMTFDLYQQFATQGAQAVTFLEHGRNRWLSWANGYKTVDSVILWWNETTEQFQTSAAVPTEYASDVVTFVVEGIPHIAFSCEKGVGQFGIIDFNKPIIIYDYRDDLGWTWKQNIMAVGIIDLDVFAINDLVYLVMVSQINGISIFQWSGASIFELYQNLPIEGAFHAHPFVHVGNLYMAVATPVTSQFAIDSRKPFIMEAIIKGQQSTTEFTTWG